MTPDNVDEWVLAAEKYNTETLKGKVKAYKKAQKGESEGDTKEVTTKTFKLHKDQEEIVEAALEKAMNMSGTDVRSVALEYICLDFMGSAGGSVESLFKQIKENVDNPQEQMQAVFTPFEKVWPEVEVTLGLDDLIED